MKKTYISIVIVILLALGAWFLLGNKEFVNPFPVLSTDSIESWELTPVYPKGTEMEKKALDEIARLHGLIGDKDHSDYSLYVGISNQYGLLGDGKSQYDYLGKALAIDSTDTGLALRNMGVLMDKLGAYNTALVAFEAAAKAQSIPFYTTALVDFLEERFPDNAEALARAREMANYPVLEGTTD